MQSESLQRFTQENIARRDQTLPLMRSLLQSQVKQMSYPRQGKKFASYTWRLLLHLIREPLSSSKRCHLVLGAVHDEGWNGVLASPDPRERADGGDRRR